MDTSTLFSIAPTFPLDDARIRALSRAKMLGSPITWGGLLAATALGVTAGAGVFGFLTLYALAGFGLQTFWRKRRASVDAASMREVIGQSNAEQDAELTRIIGRLETAGLPQYALCLGRFLLLKRKIESDIHRGGHLAPFAPEIEKGVDGICAEVCREITSLREREKSLGDILTSRNQEQLDRLEAARRDSHAAILHAYTSLYQIHTELLGIGTPKPGTNAKETAAEPNKRLHQLVGDLREEAGLIARAHARIRSSLDDAVPAEESAPPQRPMESA